MDEEAPEGLPQRKWKMGHNRYWLENRGQNTEGSSKVLKKQVKQLMKKDPPLELKEKQPMPAGDIKVLVMLRKNL